MRITDLISMGLDYLWLGVLVAGILGIGFVIWYFGYFKRKWPDKKLNKGKAFLWCVFVIYLVVVIGVTMLSRGNFYGNAKIYPLFYSYRDAWNDFSLTEWRNIILNICMFVPFGVFVPMLLKRLDSFGKVSVCGLCLTLFIECSQLLLKRGVFEPDDLLGNTVGAMIGYGLFCFGKYIVYRKKIKEHDKISKVLCLQIPLLVTVVMFLGIFLAYEWKEFGNLRSRNVLRQKNIEVVCEETFDENVGNAVVFKAKVLTAEETEKFAGGIFEKLGTSIDESRTDIYENTAIFYSEGDGTRGNRFSLWMEYDGGIFTFRDYEKSFDEEQIAKVKTDATENEIRTVLEQLGVFVPKEAVFKNQEDGHYYFMAERLVGENKMYDGYIECEYYEDGQVGGINYQMLTLDIYKSVEIISQSEAYTQIEEGKFSYWRPNDELLKIEITGVETGYELDTKGFYQPVYLFDAVVNETKTQIIIPAIQ